MSEAASLLTQASVVAIDGRALVIAGEPGIGKSSLALALIDRGAALIGDDGVTLERRGDTVFASAPPNIGGKLELHGVGIVECETAGPMPIALILELGADIDRMPADLSSRDILGISIPTLPFAPGTIAPAVRAEWALKQHGLGSD